MRLDDGSTIPLTQALRDKIWNQTLAYGTGVLSFADMELIRHLTGCCGLGSKTLRCLGFAVVDAPPAKADLEKQAIESANFIKLEVRWVRW